MKIVYLLAATSLVLSSAAIAQTTTSSGAVQQSPTAGAQHPAPNLRQSLTGDLEKAGFTDVKIMPDSFLVRAKDKSGNPITMMIDPNSVTEVVDDSTAAMGAPATGATANATPASTFETVPQSDRLSTKIVGLDVRSPSNEDIGTIKDIAYAGQRVRAYIVGVGGYLGIGDHDVAVNPSAIRISYDPNAKNWHAVMDTTAAQLKAAPQFKYSSQS